MNEKKQSSIMGIEEIEQSMKELAVPIDFAALVKAGVLEKHGNYYKILQKSKLPPHIMTVVHDIKIKNDGSPSLFRFRESKRIAKRAEKILKQIEARKKLVSK
jgi:hypothetical protein